MNARDEIPSMKVLVVGGTGGFGSTICRLLRDDGHHVVAAGRDAAKGEDFTRNADNRGMGFTNLDRDLIDAGTLDGYDVVVDAAGPFRGQGRALARASIAAGLHHIDIADDRAFVNEVGLLDEAARRAGVACLSGASSVPALSTAVAMRLARDLDETLLVEIAISASSQAAFGRSVLHSMLSGAGRPVRRRDGTTGIAMANARPIVMETASGLIERTVLEVDGPDHDILPKMMKGAPSVRFHAGGEFRIHNLAMRLIAAIVSRGVLTDGSSLLPLAEAARRLTASMGDGRSGMQVEVTGDVDGRRRRRTWSLIAARNMGPMVPCLVVPALVAALAKGGIEPGARPAAGLLSMDEILSRMPIGSIETRIGDVPATPVYGHMNGHGALSPEVAAMHDVPRHAMARGVAQIERGRGVLARIVAAAFGFPPAGRDVPVTVTFEATAQGERWTRDFGGRRFSSMLTSTPTGVRERFGPFSFRFRLEERNGGLAMVPRTWRAFGVRMPKALMPGGVATEAAVDGRFTFDVPISVPFVGLVVHYRGWLAPVVTE